MTVFATASDNCRAMATSSIDRAIRLSTAAAVLVVAGIAAYVSYWHAYAVVRAHGEGGVTARLEPATIDGLVYASSMVILYAARHGSPVPRLARWLLGLGIAATLTANMAQGWSHGPVGAVVAAWPAVSLVGSYELLVWLIRTCGTVEHRPPPGTPATPRPAALQGVLPRPQPLAPSSPAGASATHQTRHGSLRLRSPVCADIQRDDGGVIGGEDVGAEKGPAGWVPAGPWCSWWRLGGQSDVTSAAAARALDSSTMALRVA